MKITTISKCHKCGIQLVYERDYEEFKGYGFVCPKCKDEYMSPKNNPNITIEFENGSTIKSLPCTVLSHVTGKIRTYGGDEKMEYKEYSSDIINTETGKVVTTVTGTLDEVLNILKPRVNEPNILDMVLPNGFSEEFKKELYIGAEVETIGNIEGNKVQTIRTKVIDLSNIDSGNIIVELIEVIISDN